MAANAGTISVALTGSTRQLEDALRKFEKRFQDFGMNLQQAGWRLGVALSVPLSAGFGFAMKKSAEFDLAMIGVAKTVNMTDAEVKKLGHEFKKMSENIPVSASELANLGKVAGQLGISKGGIKDFVRVMADLGVSTNMTSEQAATALARLRNIMGVSEKSFSNLASSVVHMGNTSAAFESEIVDLSMRLGGAGKVMGLTAGQVIGLAAGLKSLGLNTESAGTSFSRVMIMMVKASQRGGEQLQAFANVTGLSAEAFKQMVQNNPAKALQMVVEGLGAVKSEGGSTFIALEKLGMANVRISDAMLRTSNAGQKLGQTMKSSEEAYNKNTAAADEANRFYKAHANQLKTLWNIVSNIAAEFGDALLPVLIEFLQTMKPLLGKIREFVQWFGMLPPQLRLGVLGVAALAAAMGPLIYVVGALIQALGALAGAGGMGLLSGVAKGFKTLSFELFALKYNFVVTRMAAGGFAATLTALKPLLVGLVTAGVLVGLTMLISKFAQAAVKAAEARQHIEDMKSSMAEGFGKLGENQTFTRLTAENRILGNLLTQYNALAAKKKQINDDVKAGKFTKAQAHGTLKVLKQQMEQLSLEIDLRKANSTALSDQYNQLLKLRIEQEKHQKVNPDSGAFGAGSDDTLKDRKKKLQDALDLNDALYKDDQENAQQRIILLKQWIAEEETAGRVRKEIWVWATKELHDAEADLLKIRQDATEKATELERDWMQYRVAAGLITKQERIKQLDEEIAKLKELGKENSREMLGLLEEKLAINQSIEKEHEKHLAKLTALQERYDRTMAMGLQNLETEFIDTFADWVTGAKVKWEDFARSLIRDFGRMIVKLIYVKSLMRALQFFQGGSMFGTAIQAGIGILTGGSGFGGFAAKGANARAGEPFIVGEKGPELFVPGRSGQITPIQAGTSSGNIVLDFSGMPSARSPMEAARDSVWQQYLRESIRVAKAQGFKG